MTDAGRRCTAQRRGLTTILLALVALVGCSIASESPSVGGSRSFGESGAPLPLGASPPPTCPPSRLDLPPPSAWWNDRVFYEVFVRSFGDSDGDGIGDLRGLIAHLNDLNDGDPSTTTDLGVTGLWLMPIFEATSYHGYDTTDYRRIAPDYGTMEDLRDLVQAAHARGIAVVLDLALNHTSDAHPWFQASAAGDADYADWYLWRDTDPAWPPVAGGQPWHRLGDRFYYGAFGPGMPDLNLRNPAVTRKLTDVARYWLAEAGVDGYRLDAAKHLVEEGVDRQLNTASTLAWLQGFRDAVHETSPSALLLGEVWDISSVSARYVSSGALDLAFDFPLAAGMVGAVRLGNRAPLLGSLAEVVDRYRGGQLATFLTNHDQNRVASELGADPGALRAAASLLLTGPGVPFIYYGEEVGMTGRKPDERIRAPMAWSSLPPGGGFSDAVPWQPMADDWPAVNVAAQRSDPDSLLAHYRRLIKLRSQVATLRRGASFVVEASSSAVWAILRSDGDDAVLVIVNLGPSTEGNVHLWLRRGPLCAVTRAETLLDDRPVGPPRLNAEGGFEDYRPVERLQPYESVLIRLEP